GEREVAGVGRRQRGDEARIDGAVEALSVEAEREGLHDLVFEIPVDGERTAIRLRGPDLHAIRAHARVARARETGDRRDCGEQAAGDDGPHRLSALPYPAPPIPATAASSEAAARAGGRLTGLTSVTWRGSSAPYPGREHIS